MYPAAHMLGSLPHAVAKGSEASGDFSYVVLWTKRLVHGTAARWGKAKTNGRATSKGRTAFSKAHLEMETYDL